MKQILKRSLAVLVAFLLCISLMPTSQIVANAATVEYVYSGDYIYNWGTRGETATFLSPNAEAFYETANTSYDELAALAGGTGTSDAPNSALYSALQDLMVDAHDYQTDYDATRTLYQYTDCQNSAKTNTAISCFYSGADIGPEWDSGVTWNREHTWPNSKGLGGNDENDIMMLRPTVSNINSARGNKAYGESSSCYNPNTPSNGALDLRGDVSRIFLYMYVRWGNTNGNGDYTAWGSTGVMESLDILISWMAADPVDTWELGRNDAVEAITGTRNVFVDYPEFAFLLFGEEVPTDMATPSGEAEGCNHNYVAGTPVAATCTAEGYTPYTCSLCGKTYNDNIVEKIAHNYVDGACDVCGKTEDVIVAIYAPAYNMALSTTKVATYYNAGVDISGGFGALTDSEKWIMTQNEDGSYTFQSVADETKYLAMADANNSLNETGANTAWTLTAIEGSDNLYYVQNVARGNYLEWYASKNNWSTYTKNSDDQFEISFYVFEECDHEYSSETVEATCTTDGYTKYTCDLCGISYIDDVIEALGHEYNEAGYCSVCEELAPEEPVYTVHFLTPDGVTPVDPIICGEETINFPAEAEAPEGYTFLGWSKTATADTTTPPTYYSAVTGTFPIDADNCRVFYALYKYEVETEAGEGDSTAAGESATASLSFADKTQRTSFSTSQQVWEQNGIKLINDKASSSSNVADYANPARFYKSSKITIEYPGMTSIAFTCGSSSYATALKNSITATANETVTVSSSVVTVTFAEAVDSFVIASLTGGQVRMKSLDVTYVSTGSGSTGPVVTTYYTTIIGDSCPHASHFFDGAVDATCTEAGKLNNLVCSDECGEILYEGAVIEAKGHVEKVLEGKDATCKETGLTEGKHCLRCDVTTVPQEEIPVTDHTYDDDADLDCNVCGDKREPLIVKGDANNDGEVDEADYAVITKILLKVEQYNELLDMNDDGKIDVIDGILLRKAML